MVMHASKNPDSLVLTQVRILSAALFFKGLQDMKQGQQLIYQQAQQSAQHNEQMFWLVFTLFGGLLGSLLLFLLKAHINSAFKAVLSLFGLLLTFALWGFLTNFREYKTHSYEVCKKIESDSQFKIKLHTGAKDKISSSISSNIGTVALLLLILGIIFIALFVLALA